MGYHFFNEWTLLHNKYFKKGQAVTGQSSPFFLNIDFSDFLFFLYIFVCIYTYIFSTIYIHIHWFLSQCTQFHFAQEIVITCRLLKIYLKKKNKGFCFSDIADFLKSLTKCLKEGSILSQRTSLPSVTATNWSCSTFGWGLLVYCYGI